MATKYKGWFLISDGFVLCHRNGQETWTPDVKRGIPAGAVSFNSKKEAEREVDSMNRQGFWPLFVSEAKAIEKEWY